MWTSERPCGECPMQKVTNSTKSELKI
jgi:hypothetical protein